MNILIPDSWLREFLETKATPEQIKEYLSLCGPSVERINVVGKEIVYDIEVTGNRPDSMSVFGVAREAAAILPRFGIAAKFINDLYDINSQKIPGMKGVQIPEISKGKRLSIITDPILNPRWTSVVIENVTVKESPEWLKKKLELTGIRSLNNVIDITNYLMRAYGQPAHAFDFDLIKDTNTTAHMTLRESKKGDKLTTLDGKTHTLPGGDIVIVDKNNRLIDLCGIMGAKNSSIQNSTTTVILFLQTYEPMHIRKTSMSLGIRTEAAQLFEKGTDTELVMPAIAKGIELITQLTGGKLASQLYDIYPKPFVPSTVSVSRNKIDAYLGIHLKDKEITDILTPLGFTPKTTSKEVITQVPSFRRDVTIDVDIIEEIARLYGYHNIVTKLPDTEPPVTRRDPMLDCEKDIKIRLRDWGYTEVYTYSMISEELMDIFGLNKKESYKISNPLSAEGVYMRPSLLPSMLTAVKQNINIEKKLKLFELSQTYEYGEQNLPIERPTLIVAQTGTTFKEVKGLVESLFEVLNVPFPELLTASTHSDLWHSTIYLDLGKYGSVGQIHETMQRSLGLPEPIRIVYLYFDELIKDAKATRSYKPIPKYPPSFEDFSFVLPPETPVGPMMEHFKSLDPLITNVALLESYENTQTFHVTFESETKNLTSEDIVPIRKKIVRVAEEKFNAKIKSQQN